MIIPKEIMRKAYEEGKVKSYESELIDNLREIKFQGTPLSICLLAKDICRCECYVSSINLTRGMDKFTLVHGDVNCIELNDEYPNHSWVEKDGFVYDTTDGFKWEKELYYSLFEPVVREVYDEKSVLDYPYYNEVIKNSQVEVPIEATALMLQYLELTDSSNPSINSERLLEEINIWREGNSMMEKFDDKIMKQYIKYMKKDDK